MRTATSSEVAPEIREFERISTTVANAYLMRLAARYVGRLAERVAGRGIRCRLLLMLSSGGLTDVEEARRFPVPMLESGPAAGAIAVAWFGAHAGPLGTDFSMATLEADRILSTTPMTADDRVAVLGYQPHAAAIWLEAGSGLAGVSRGIFDAPSAARVHIAELDATPDVRVGRARSMPGPEASASCPPSAGVASALGPCWRRTGRTGWRRLRRMVAGRCWRTPDHLARISLWPLLRQTAS